MALRLFIGQLASAHHLLHHRVILGELLDFAAPNGIGAAVAHMHYQHGGILDKNKFAGGAHACQLRIM